MPVDHVGSNVSECNGSYPAGVWVCRFLTEMAACVIEAGACAGAFQGGGGVPGTSPGKISKNEAKSCIPSKKRRVPGTQEPIRGTRLRGYGPIQ